MNKIVKLDNELFVFLNGLGSSQYDGLWLFITKQLHWAPLFAFVFYLLIRKIGWKHFMMIVLFLAVMITFTDQFTNLIKYSVQRLRPCNDPEIKDVIRIVKSSSSFSYFSGHASNSMAATTFIVLIMRKYYKYSLVLFLFPLIFAYSRIYLGLHFPGDILSGYIFGALSGFGFFKIYLIFKRKYFPECI